jgi:hypothetical protein
MVCRPIAHDGPDQRRRALAPRSGIALEQRRSPFAPVLLRDPSGKRRPYALFCTDPASTIHQIIAWYISRWQIEVTFEEVRCHLGVETQRQWSPRAIARTTPCLLGLFSLVLLLAYRLSPKGLPTRQAAWYAKSAPTIADALAFVRRQLWVEVNSPLSLQTAPMGNSSAHMLNLLIEAACYAAWSVQKGQSRVILDPSAGVRW